MDVDFFVSRERETKSQHPYGIYDSLEVLQNHEILACLKAESVTASAGKLHTARVTVKGIGTLMNGTPICDGMTGDGIKYCTMPRPGGFSTSSEHGCEARRGCAPPRPVFTVTLVRCVAFQLAEA